ncbi:MAG: hypothetical protein GX115_18250 [Ruminiclostridium sp.]|nr:hypothetical protein [Ruminiclostridium sp.]
MKTYRCLVCGYIHEGSEPPESCPICGVPSSEVLKVLGLDLFSIGECMPRDENCIQYEREAPGSYVLFVFREGRMVGSIVIGDKALAAKAKQAVEKGFNYTEHNGDVEGIIRQIS